MVFNWFQRLFEHQTAYQQTALYTYKKGLFVGSFLYVWFVFQSSIFRAPFVLKNCTFRFADYIFLRNRQPVLRKKIPLRVLQRKAKVKLRLLPRHRHILPQKVSTIWAKIYASSCKSKGTFCALQRTAERRTTGGNGCQCGCNDLIFSWLGATWCTNIRKEQYG